MTSEPKPKRGRFRGLLKKLLFAAIPFLVLLVVAEIVLRVADIEPPGFRDIGDRETLGLVEPHPVRGYAYVPSVTRQITRRGRTVEVRTNELGCREHRDVAPGPAADVLALGDSFTMGYGLAARESWPARVEAKLSADGQPVRVLNAAVAGYSLEQIRLTAEQFAPTTGCRVMVVGLYPAGAGRLESPYVVHHGVLVKSGLLDFIEDVGGRPYLSPFARPWLRGLDTFMGRWFWCGAFLLRGAVAVRDLFRGSETGGGEAPDRPLPDAFFTELRRLRDVAAANDADLVVLVVSIQEGDGSFSDIERARRDRVVALCADEGIAVVDPMPAFEAESSEPVFRLPGDWHWSARANDVASTLLVDDALRGSLGR